MNDLENEIWKDIPGYEGLYQASNLGRIKSLLRQEISIHPKTRQKFIRRRNEKILKPGIDKDGYLKIVLCKDGNPISFSVHRLIARIFIPNPNNLPEINHKNGIKNQNNIINLEWSNRSKNMCHAYATNLWDKEKVQGEKHWSTFLKNEDILEIRKLYKSGKYTQKEIGEKFDIDASNISRIVNKIYWGHI